MNFSKTNIVTLMIVAAAILCLQMFDISPVISLDQAELIQSSSVVAESISNGLAPKSYQESNVGFENHYVEMLWGITQKFETLNEGEMPVNGIRQANTLGETNLKNNWGADDLVGSLNQAQISKKFYQLKEGDSASRIAAMSGLDVDMLRMVNLIRDGESLFVGQVLFIPNEQDLDISLDEDLEWPFEYEELPFVISQFYRSELTLEHGDDGHGRAHAHEGIDFALPNKSPIRASASGLVTFSGWDPIGYGNMVLIYHGENIFTLYAHLDSIKVTTGQSVNQSAVIGYAGNTGFSSNTHLHFEVIHRFNSLNPCRHIAAGCKPIEYQAN